MTHDEREEQLFQELKAELQRAFAAPESSYVQVTLEQFLARMQRKEKPHTEGAGSEPDAGGGDQATLDSAKLSPSSGSRST